MSFADDAIRARLNAIEDRLERLEEGLIADREVRQLGHRLVWNEKGRCNVLGIPTLSGKALKTQLERQRKFY